MKWNDYLSAIALLFVMATLALLAVTIAGGRVLHDPSDGPHGLMGPGQDGLPTFASGDDLLEAFRSASSRQSQGWLFDGLGLLSGNAAKSGLPAPQALRSTSVEYSTTNVQVQGVDEADVIKTDGEYIYTIANGKLLIAKAYPAGEAKVVSSKAFTSFRPSELFADGDRLLVFGTSSGTLPVPLEAGKTAESAWLYAYMTVAKLYDISDRAAPELLRTFEVEGNYLTSRMIGHDVYFVVNSYPRICPCDSSKPGDIIPLCREGTEPAMPIASPTEIAYIPHVPAASFITIASISMSDKDEEIVKRTVAGSGQNVYASLDSLYIAETNRYGPYLFDLVEIGRDEKTTIVKFDLKGGNITCAGTGEVKGHILNQFSMDEYDGHFRIATTVGEVWDTKTPSTNNVYVLDEDMRIVGSLEDLAPGEKIYSTRFMGPRCYMVTFKKVDPLFVIDLSSPAHPKVLGKLKIPGYSDYLHPYDETHVIGIGKDAMDAGDAEVSARSLDFAWYQGVKMALFDVSDVENPREMYKVVIGDRGTDSPVLSDHRAFLFDKGSGLLVLPVTVAEIKEERTSWNQYGEYVFQGAYVYRVDLANGFKLRGKVTQYDDDEVYKKSGYYFYGDRSITRSLYIDDVLYTLSSSRLQLNDLATLERLKVLKLDEPGDRDP